MNGRNIVELDRILNEARLAAADVAGTLENLADLYAELAVSRSGGGAEERRLSATFATIHAHASRVVGLIEEGIG